MTILFLRDVSLELAVLFGCLSVALHAMAWDARKRLRASLKIPLTHEAEGVTHRWEGRAGLYHTIAIALSVFSILSAVTWLFSPPIQ